MLGGSLVVGLCLLLLGWTAEFVGIFVSDEAKRKSATIAVAVLSIYAVDFSINVVQACCRSLIVDTLPIPQQQLGSAWASRMVAIGHLVGYAIGSVDTVKIFGTAFGDTQFKQMTVIAALSLIISTSVTSYAVRERVLVSVRFVRCKALLFALLLTSNEGTPTVKLELSRSCRNYLRPLSTSLHVSGPYAGHSSGRGSAGSPFCFTAQRGSARLTSGMRRQRQMLKSLRTLWVTLDVLGVCHW